MLNDSRILRRLVTAVLAALVASLLAVSPAVADDQPNNGEIDFTDTDEQEGTDGTDPQGPPPCDIQQGDNGCYEGKSCLINNPAKNAEEDVLEYLPPKPGDDYHAAFRSCRGGPTEWYWSQDGQPSVADLAMTAYGQLPFPFITPTFNPPTRTLVNLDTWWWAEGADMGPLTATAGSVTATATPQSMEVDPGDGSAILTCSFQTQRSDACVHVYRKGSGSGGYTARVRLSWTVTFDDAGTPLRGAGLPTGFTIPWDEVVVPVREVQSRVTKSGR